MELNENTKYVSELTTALAYYKLIYVESLTKDKSLDSFILLGGEDYLDKVIREDSDNISLETTNLYMMKKFNRLIKTATTGRVSLSNIILKDINNLGWLDEIISEIDPSEKLRDTICGSCSYEVYDKIINSRIIGSSHINEKKELQTECEEVLKLLKKNSIN